MYERFLFVPQQQQYVQPHKLAQAHLATPLIPRRQVASIGPPGGTRQLPNQVLPDLAQYSPYTYTEGKAGGQIDWLSS